LAPEVLNTYRGKHIAIIHKTVVAVGDTYAQLRADVDQRYPNELPYLAYIAGDGGASAGVDQTPNTQVAEPVAAEISDDTAEPLPDLPPSVEAQALAAPVDDDELLPIVPLPAGLPEPERVPEAVPRRTLTKKTGRQQVNSKLRKLT
jgi:hypothetical protein